MSSISACAKSSAFVVSTKSFIASVWFTAFSAMTTSIISPIPVVVATVSGSVCCCSCSCSMSFGLNLMVFGLRCGTFLRLRLIRGIAEQRNFAFHLRLTCVCRTIYSPKRKLFFFSLTNVTKSISITTEVEHNFNLGKISKIWFGQNKTFLRTKRLLIWFDWIGKLEKTLKCALFCVVAFVTTIKTYFYFSFGNVVKTT